MFATMTARGHRPWTVAAATLMLFGALWACAQGLAGRQSPSLPPATEITQDNLAANLFALGRRAAAAPRAEQPDDAAVTPVFMTPSVPAALQGRQAGTVRPAPARIVPPRDGQAALARGPPLSL